MKFFKLICLLVFCTLAGCSQHKQYMQPLALADYGDALVIDNVHIVDVVAKSIIRNQTLVVENGFIKGIYGRSGRPLAQNTYPKLDAQGLYLMPGLIDGHTHLQGMMRPPAVFVRPELENNAKRMVMAGVTTVFDMGGDIKKLQSLDKAIQRREKIGPDLLYTDKHITIDGGYPTDWAYFFSWPLRNVAKHFLANQVSGRDDIDQILTRIVKYKGNYVKLGYEQTSTSGPRLFSDLMDYVCNGAKQRGLKVFAHLGNNYEAREAMRSGVSVFTHNIHREAIEPDVLAQMKVEGIKVIPTGMIFERLTDVYYNASIPWTRMTLKTTAKNSLKHLEEFMKKDKRALDPKVQSIFIELAKKKSVRAQNLALLIDAEVDLIIGSDTPVLGLQAGAGLHEELNYLNGFGISAPDLIQMVTWGNARHLDLTDRGKVEAGLRADLVLLRENPLESLSALDTLEYTLLNGKPIKL